MDNFKMYKLLGSILVIALHNKAIDATGCVGKCPNHAASDGSVAFLPHENCDMFCMCNFGKPIEMSCPADLHFSPKWNTCADPSTAECAGNKLTSDTNLRKIKPKEDGKGCMGKCPPKKPYATKVHYLPHVDCNKFCVCVAGRSQVTECAYNMHWSVALEICTHPTEAQCRRDSYDCIGICPAVENPKHAVLLAHDDCKKFCHCKKGRPVVKDCDEAEHFSWDDEICLPYQEAPCNRSNPYIPTPPPMPDNAIKKGCLTECPAFWVTLIPHKDCTKYCHCENGKSTVVECDAGTHYSVDEESCVNPWDAKCTGSNGYKPTTTTERYNDPQCIGTCPANQDPLHATLLEHEECWKYCRCYPGYQVVRHCPRGKHFSLKAAACVKPEIAKCTGIGGWEDEDGDKDTTTTTRRPTPPDTSVDSKGCKGKCPIHNSLNYTVHLPHEDCDKFCKCDWGKPYVFVCPDNLHFNPREEVCDYPFNVNCTGYGGIIEWKYLSGTDDCLGRCPLHNSLNYTVHLAHRQCNKFCKCNWGKPVVMECPDNLHFNAKEEVCDFPFNVNCTGSKSAMDDQIY